MRQSEIRTSRERYKIYRDRFYIWTYWTPELWKRFNKITEDNMYKKKICGVPFMTRLHARHVAVQLYGSKILSHIHIISGKKLIKMGIRNLPKANHNKIVYKGKLKPLRPYIYPPEYRIDSHRRRHFIQYLFKWRKRGIKIFNQKYKMFFYGHRHSVTYYNQEVRAVTKKIYSILSETPSVDIPREEVLRRLQGQVSS